METTVFSGKVCVYEHSDLASPPVAGISAAHSFRPSPLLPGGAVHLGAHTVASPMSLPVSSPVRWIGTPVSSASKHPESELCAVSPVTSLLIRHSVAGGVSQASDGGRTQPHGSWSHTPLSPEELAVAGRSFLVSGADPGAALRGTAFTSRGLTWTLRGSSFTRLLAIALSFF